MQQNEKIDLAGDAGLGEHVLQMRLRRAFADAECGRSLGNGAPEQKLVGRSRLRRREFEGAGNRTSAAAAAASASDSKAAQRSSSSRFAQKSFMQAFLYLRAVIWPVRE